MFRASLVAVVVFVLAAPTGGQDSLAPTTAPASASDADTEPRPIDENIIEVTEHGNVRLIVSDMSLSSVLRILSMRSRRNIIATPSVQGSVTANLYDVSFEEALDAILIANHSGYRSRGNFIYVYTDEELAQIIAGETPSVTRVFRLNYITAVDAKPIVEPLLGSNGKIVISSAPETGISPSPTSAGGNASAAHDLLVVHDDPQYVARIGRLLEQIDVRPQQVLVEATILRAQLTEDNALGIDFTLVGGVDLELLGAESVGITNMALGSLPQDRFEKFNATMQTEFTAAVPPGGMTLGIIKDHVAMFIRALEGIADTTVIANPKVLALNKQKGEVIVGRQEGYPIILTTETTSQQTTKMLDTGTRLLFRPYIGSDGYVRMELHPEDSRGEVVDGLPQKETTEVTTNVIVRDGQTILIGGLFRESTRDSRGQIPLLGNIPVLGAAFQSRRDTTDREEVIILLTVHIVKDEAYAREGRQQLEEIERFRVGARRGIQWHGRERLAQAHYRKAIEHFTAGDDEKALWNVRMALHNSPRFMSAIHLKEKLLNRRSWDDEGSETRLFIHRQIAREQGLREPFYERLAPPFVREEPTVESAEPENLAPESEP